MTPFAHLDKLAQPARSVPPVTLRRIETFLYRARVSRPVVSTITTFHERVALLVRVEDADGAFGWGEVYVSMPPYGAEHRVRTVHQMLAPLLLGQAVESPAAAWRRLTQKTYAMAVQTGEHGPFSAAISGVDCALWDLFARRAGLPLHALLGASAGAPVLPTVTQPALPAVPPPALPAYASGLNPASGPQEVEAARASGYRAFKQKIGFGDAIDLGNLQRIRSGMRQGEALMVDVNQGWHLDEALRVAPLLAPFDLAWVEEPLLADRPALEWRQCAKAFSSVLAGGENLMGGEFDEQSEWLGVIQPDVGKWGGISANWAVAQAARVRGKRYCPHWLAAGVGLLASAHLLAAVGGDGMLEVDFNESALREVLAQPFPPLVDGKFVLNATPGLGVAPDLAHAAQSLQHPEESA